MTEREAREQLVEVAASFHRRGLSPGSSGNLSVRLPDGFLCTPTNASLGSLDPRRLSKLDEGGAHVSGDPPTKETFLHLAMYGQRPDANAVVHLHSPFAVAVSCLADLDERSVLPPITPYFVMRVGKLPLVEYVRPGDPKLGEAVANVARSHACVLLANHGPVTSGRTLGEAVNAAEELEETARLYLTLRGQALRVLTSEQIDELRRVFGAHWPDE
ncbi:3-oxo-tetronate 4-phosphate decarboxylase [Deinococcus yavapaiensis]|uniref:3-oxo-tetronate 4-phosphate decarboxylase n=1 Tax=Deinococcus yavapaiensis KR-236 TaxID=694435 RepID=A0A318SJX5_9DEIO|nr:3-oxo-tetronate 4-phosphate decarboxylase [Deinococcus yavapaiensis]PYE54586.1 ribulose-5-phosphate 4-epimerase/fuculose-1-phosphate aldolase [Deinococcus yavapaiensis KR-236]